MSGTLSACASESLGTRWSPLRSDRPATLSQPFGLRGASLDTGGLRCAPTTGYSLATLRVAGCFTRGTRWSPLRSDHRLLSRNPSGCRSSLHNVTAAVLFVILTRDSVAGAAFVGRLAGAQLDRHRTAGL